MLNRFSASLFAVFALAAVANAQVTIRSQGVFKDKESTEHRWYVNGAHTLVWDDKPFVPVGGLFQAKSWGATATEADYESDVAALKVLQAHGVMDIYVQPAKGGITAVKPTNIQRLVDYLDANGFTYGVSCNDGPREALIGYVIRPGAFRQVVPPGGGDIKFTVPNAASALYLTVSTSGGDVREIGDAAQDGDTLRVAAKADVDASLTDPSRQIVVLLVPERIYTPGRAAVGGDIGMRNLWEGFDAYRDSLITTFSAVHFGKGFRFLCDPLPADLALTDTYARFLPTSDAFRTEWSAFLGKKYRSMSNLIQSWGIQDPIIASFDSAAKLIPLWSGGKGVPLFYLPPSKDRLRVESSRSAFWSDLSAFKAESARGYMNDLAVTLKRTVADVPVVYRNGAGAGWNELFAGVPPSRGFDGMGIVAYGRGSELATRSAAYTLAQAAEAPKTIWLPVLGTADAPYRNGKSTPGYDSKVSLTSGFDWLREAGAKGFYSTGVRIADPTRSLFDLSVVPEQLDWLHNYAALLDKTGMRTSTSGSGASQAPAAVFYPRRELPDLSPTTLTSGGGWWLPTSRAGQNYYFGATGRAYAIEEPGAGTVYYLWNSGASKRITITIPKTALSDKNGSRIAWSANAKGDIDTKKQTLSVTIGPEPIRILNCPVIPVPLEAYPEARKEAEALIKVAKDAKSQDAGRYLLNLHSIQYKGDNPYPGLSETLAFLEQLRANNRRYLWIDAEVTGTHSFDEASDKPGASGGRVLRVDARLDDSHALARYNINLGDEAPREIWVAMSPDALISLRLDGRPLVNEATIPRRVGNLYADGSLCWMCFGTATIPRGTHVLEARADGPALLDVILFARDPFTPDGPNQPPSIP